MNCQKVRDTIDDFLEIHGSLSSFRDSCSPELKAHLSECSDCSLYLDEVVMPLVDAPLLESPKVPGRTRRAARSRTFRSRFRRRVLQLSAITGLCMVFLVIGYNLKSPPPIDVVHLNHETFPAGNNACQLMTVGHFGGGSATGPVGTVVPHEVSLSGPGSFTLPSKLSARGRYRLDTSRIELTDSEACIAFVSAMGETLVFHLRKLDKPVEEMEYEVTPDPKRVLTYTVTWTSEQWLCSITGRLPPEFLMDFAKELSIEA